MSRTRNQDFYKSKKWVTKREKIMKRDKYECQNCRRYYKTKQATTVHHIYFFDDFAELGLQNWNLVSLCSSCHNKMHNRNDDSATKLGQEYQLKRKKEFDNFYKDKK